jgi:hypothetical protein
MRTIPQNQQSLAERIAVLEARAGIRASEAAAKPVPPLMGAMRETGPRPRLTALVSTAEQRSITDRMAARAVQMQQHAQTTRFFSAPAESKDARVPRASRTGSVV